MPVLNIPTGMQCSERLQALTHLVPLHCRTAYQAESPQVQAAAAALKQTFDSEVADIRSGLEAELAAAKSAAAKSAAKAKAERQNAHKAERERAQADVKEIVEERYALLVHTLILGLSLV